MQYRIYLSQVWTYSTFIDAADQEEAKMKANLIAEELSPADDRMTYCGLHMDVEPVSDAFAR